MANLTVVVSFFFRFTGGRIDDDDDASRDNTEAIRNTFTWGSSPKQRGGQTFALSALSTVGGHAEQGISVHVERATDQEVRSFWNEGETMGDRTYKLQTLHGKSDIELAMENK